MGRLPRQPSPLLPARRRQSLISAKLRAEAASKNWFPTLGPSVSLTDLGDLVAGLLIEQVLFDNGRRKAEREFAAADVEVAAVSLSQDMNGRVETAVGLYAAALRGDEKAAYGDRALRRMQEFRRIVQGRVDGGVSDRADLNVVDSKISGIRTATATARDAATTARAELQAMTGQSFEQKPSHLSIGTPPEQGQFLSVLKAGAEAERTIAQAQIGPRRAPAADFRGWKCDHRWLRSRNYPRYGAAAGGWVPLPRFKR